VSTGTVIAGRYRLREAIGSGGMGQVWLAADDMLGRDVAVKEVTTPDSGQFATVRQSLREARSAASLNHPNVVQIHDVLHTDRPWIVMEYVPSRSLYDVIVRDGPLSPREAARVGLGMLAGLRAAHRAGIIHRDVKPQNVLVGHDGRVVLTDFGLAVREREGAGRAEALIGSPQYIAPERVRDGASTPATDMWSLGATLYAAVEGRAPYQRESTAGTLVALANQPPDPMRRAGPLAPILLRLLDRDPSRRADADAVEGWLRPIAEGVPQAAERSPDEAALARLTRIQLAVASFVLAATATVAVILATGWS